MSPERKPLVVIEDRIEVNASPEVLWTCFADVGKGPNWFPSLVEAEWAAGSPWTLGAKMRQTIQFGFPLGNVTGTATLIEISASPYAAWKGSVAGMEATQGFCFNATASGTEVISRSEFYGAMAFLARISFVIRHIRRKYQEALQGLKAYVETGTIQLKMPM
jgi:hypothetical protein